MARLTMLAVASLLLAAAPAGAQVGRWADEIAEASARFGVPAPWVRRVMVAESNGLTMLNGRPITSRAGALGLMQLMPQTWLEMRDRHGLGSDPFDPHDNILAGAAYLRAMYDRFGYPGLFAAYNAGPGRYARHLATGEKLPLETRLYVARTGGIAAGSRVAARPMIRLFALQPRTDGRTIPVTPNGVAELFAVRR